MGSARAPEEEVTGVDRSRLTGEREIRGDTQGETELLRRMLDAAEHYVRSHKWCPPIVERYLGYGVGGIVGVFLFRFARPIGDAGDRELWVVEGDLPSAYLVTDDAPTPKAALERYCELMENWAQGVLRGDGVSGRYPVPVEPTREHADMLMKRVVFIRENIIPNAP
jgi:hypothetical protein